MFLGFSGGGFFAGTTALVAVALATLAVLRATLAGHPFEGLGRGAAAAAAALGLFAAWTLASGWWSDAPSRALLEFDRALLYLLAFVLFASFASSSARLSWMLRGLAAGIAVVCVAGLITRVLPELWPISPNVANERLSYPVTYWNALGLLAGMGVILLLHLSAAARERAPVRVLAAALVPLLASTLLLTFSRGAIVATAAGLVAYAVLGRSRGLIAALLAIAPATVVALLATWDADLLFEEDPTGPAAVAQGEDLALVLAACAVGATAVRAALLPVERRVAALHMPARGRRVLGGAVALLAAAGLAGAGMALDLPSRASDQFENFVERDRVADTGDLRERLTSPANSGRIDHWQVALDAFERDPVAGHGAGTYQVLWARYREDDFIVVDGHSLYLEVLGELGVVGLVLLLVALGAIVGGLALRARGEERPAWAAAFGVVLAWALHAGIDWDWEMPVVTLVAFVLGGAGLALPAGKAALRAPGRGARVTAGLALLVLAVTPALVAVSQERLDEAVSAFGRGDCPAAIDAALGSAAAVGARPEPFALLGYCDVRLGAPALGVRMLERAVERDPENWEFRYGLALVRGAAGLDPRPAARQALRLNPRSSLARDAVERFRGDDPSRWRRAALAARLPFWWVRLRPSGVAASGRPPAARCPPAAPAMRRSP